METNFLTLAVAVSTNYYVIVLHDLVISTDRATFVVYNIYAAEIQILLKEALN